MEPLGRLEERFWVFVAVPQEVDEFSPPSLRRRGLGLHGPGTTTF